jgi:hypothetical protein
MTKNYVITDTRAKAFYTFTDKTDMGWPRHNFSNNIGEAKKYKTRADAARIAHLLQNILETPVRVRNAV